MSDPHPILSDRERRSEDIAHLLVEHPFVIQIRANVPSAEKNHPIANRLVRFFANQLSFFDAACFFREGPDGPAFLIGLDADSGDDLKRRLSALEDDSDLGRLVDLDLYGRDREYHRDTLRTCFLCDRPAHECHRLARHTEGELMDYFEKTSLEGLSDRISTLAFTSILEELDLDPKFGLVSRKSRGSHPDMDAERMLRAQAAITPFFPRMFCCGYENEDILETFTRIRTIGLEAEAKMFEATGGVNAYKGLIFALGVATGALGHTIRQNGSFESIFDTVRTLTKDMGKEWNSGEPSFGKSAYRDFGFQGARGEAMAGFPSVRSVLPLLEDNTREATLMALVRLIGEVEDTTLLKRCKSIEKYHQVQEMFRSISTFDEARFERLTAWCVEENLSFGGSADMLVVALFLTKVRRMLF